MTRRRPNEVTYSSAGPVSAGHLVDAARGMKVIKEPGVKID